MKSTPRWTWGPTLLWRQPATKPYSQEFIHPLILSPTPTYIGIEKQKNEENNAKKIEFVFHLVLLGIIKRKPRGTKPPGSSKPIKPKHFIRFYSVGVFYLLLSVPTFLCSRTLSTSEKLNFGGGLESTSSVEWKPRGTAPPQCESSKWKDFKKLPLAYREVC